MGFGVDDHRIRGLMSFGEMTSRKLLKKDVEQVGGSQSERKAFLKLLEGLNLFLFNFDYSKSRTTKRDSRSVDQMLNKMLKSTSTSSTLSQSSMFLTLFLGWTG